MMTQSEHYIMRLQTEVKVLRAENEALKESKAGHAAESAELIKLLQAERAENERLRSALEDIEKFGHGNGHGRGYTCANMAQDAVDAAREGA